MTSSSGILRDFIHLGQSEEEVEVLGFKVKYRTLTTDEQTAVFDHCARYSDFARVSALRRETLIYAMETVNGIPLEEAYRKKDEEDLSDLEKRRRIIGAMDTEAINVFFSKHSDVSEKRTKVLADLSKDKEEATETSIQMEEEVKNLPSENPID